MASSINQKIVAAVFSQSEFDSKYNPCIWGSDSMGEYFRFRYSIAEDYYWYPDFNKDVLFMRWEREINEIPGIKFRSIFKGYDLENHWRQALMMKNGECYLIRGARIAYGSDIVGPRGKPCYSFRTDNTEQGTHIVKTEISLKKMLNKLEVILL